MTKFGIGQPVPRLEDPRFITGRGRFVDDIELPRQCHGIVVMSPHAHARIKRVETAQAKAADGVVVVLTGADLEADKLGALVPVMPEDMGGPKGSIPPIAQITTTKSGGARQTARRTKPTSATAKSPGRLDRTRPHRIVQRRAFRNASIDGGEVT